MMRGLDHKARVAASFGAAASRYDSAAALQRDVAERLTMRIDRLPLPLRPRILEIGCGTGHLSLALRRVIRGADWLITDVSEEMLTRCREKLGGPADTRFLAMDGEHPAAETRFDLICSSLAFQWFNDLESGALRLARLLRPGGHLAFSTLAAETFREWRRAHEALGLRASMPPNPTLDSLAEIWPDAGTRHVEDERIVRNFANARDFVDDLKTIGADTPAPGYEPLSAGALRRVLRALDAGDGVRMTYHVAYCIFTRAGP